MLFKSATPAAAIPEEVEPVADTEMESETGDDDDKLTTAIFDAAATTSAADAATSSAAAIITNVNDFYQPLDALLQTVAASKGTDVNTLIRNYMVILTCSFFLTSFSVIPKLNLYCHWLDTVCSCSSVLRFDFLVPCPHFPFRLIHFAV